MPAYGDNEQLRLLERGISSICVLGDAGTPPVPADVQAMWIGDTTAVGGQTRERRANYVWMWDAGAAYCFIGGLNSSVLAGLNVAFSFTQPVFQDFQGPPANELCVQDANTIAVALPADVYSSVPAIYLFGHSWGGAVAQVLRDALTPRGGGNKDVRLYTYAAPKVYAANVTGLRATVETHVAVYNDPVVRLPPNLEDAEEGAFASPANGNAEFTFRNADQFAAVRRMVVIGPPDVVFGRVATPLLSAAQLRALSYFVQLGTAIGAPHAMGTYRDILRGLWDRVQANDVVPPQLNRTPETLGKLRVFGESPPPVRSPIFRGPLTPAEELILADAVRVYGQSRPGTPPPDPGPVAPSAPVGNKPRIVSFSPPSGPQSGGTVVTIRGVGLANVQEVWFGLVPAESISRSPVAVLSDTIMLVTTPPQLPSQVRIGLQWPGGFAPGRARQTYQYTGTGPPP